MNAVVVVTLQQLEKIKHNKMIERTMDMEELTIEQLEKQCAEAKMQFQTLRDQLIQAKKKEEEARQARLRAEKEVRYKEVIDAYNAFEKLRSKYVEDYGSFTFLTDGRVFSLRNFFFEKV